MEQNHIEVVLVYKKYDFSKEINDGELPIKKLAEVELDNYPEYIKLGKWSCDKEIIVRPYLKVKFEGKYYNVDIAIKICKDLAETVDKITAGQDGYEYQKHKEEDFIYFVPPMRWERNKYNKIKPTIEGHYVKIGHEKIQILFKDGRTETMILKSEVQKKQKDFYKDIILDLISLDCMLCMDSNSLTSISITQDLYKNTKELIDEFFNAYKELEKRAQKGLKAYKEKKPFNKVKKISSQALVEHEIFHKEKVNAISYKDDFDIYEHRVIKTHLFRLKNLVNIRRKIEKQMFTREKNQLKESLQNIQDLNEDKIKESISRYEKQLEKRRQKIKEKFQNSCQEVPELKEVYIEFNVLDVEIFNEQDIYLYNGYNELLEHPYIYLKKGHPDEGIGGTGIAKKRQYRTYENGKASELKDYKEKAKYPTQYITIKIFMDCMDAAAKIYHALYSEHRNIHKGDIIGIHGFVDKNYVTLQDKNYDKFTFQFYKILEIKKNNSPIINKSDNYIQEYMDYLFNWDLKGVEENLSFYQEAFDIRNKLAEINQKLNDIESKTNKWTLLNQQLDKIENSVLMKATKNFKTPIRTTNLFAFNPLYQKMYSIITKDNKQIENIEYYSKDSFDDIKIAKLPQLYEVWCYIKVIQIFVIDYGFQIQEISTVHDETGIKSLRKYIHYILTEGTLSETRCDLQGTIGDKTMKVVIWYNKSIKINREELKRENIFAINKKGKNKGKVREKEELKPDILLRINYNGIGKFFVLDAKNKGLNHDEGQDICETAFQKYTLELGQGMEVNDEFENVSHTKPYIDGSFILQPFSKKEEDIPDKQAKARVSYSPQRYLGAYPERVFIGKGWLEKCKEWLVQEDKLSEWINRFAGNNNGVHENSIGIITLQPHWNNMPYLMQMIMEKHFNLYKEKCWLCGHNYQENEIKKKYTKAKYPKYHIKCPKCSKGSFFVETHCINSKQPSHGNVKLGKHFVNYYAQVISKERTCWNVSCPVCRETLGNNYI